jgi:hypothetical protein
MPALYISVFLYIKKKGRIALKNSTTNSDPFGPGKTDDFEIITYDVGSLQEIM